MCSILFTNINSDLQSANKFLKFRGPDNTNIISVNNFTFLHNLLSITGTFTTQPFIDDEIVALYNGEIYNFKNFGDYDSDGKCIIDLYKQYGAKFVEQLDGEFAIILIDFKTKKIILSTDIFATKPLWVSIENNNIGVATYASALKELGFKQQEKIKANTTLIIDVTTLEIISNFPVYKFDLKQYKTNFDDWNESFYNAIYKRTHNCREGIFIGLSSGYDSGVISCELNKQKVPYKAYSVRGAEKIDIIEERHRLFNDNASGEILTLTPELRSKAHEYINTYVEEFYYRTYSSSSNYNEFNLRLQDDNGANGLSFICSLAKKDNKKIYISGQGADEIFADYGFGGIKKYSHSNFGGSFPVDLEEIFPWASFFGSSQISYLAKDEYIAGSYGIEGRYPFLDKQVVQEFLWLDVKLKNENYKSVLYNYLINNNYPFVKDVKIGF